MSNPTRYRYRDLKPEDPYYEAWKYLHTGESVQAIGLGLGMLLFFATMAVAFMGPPVVLIYLMAAVAMGLFLVGGGLGMIWIIGFICPRCGKSRMNQVSMNDSICPDCGLPKWAPDDPDKEPPAP